MIGTIEILTVAELVVVAICIGLTALYRCSINYIHRIMAMVKLLMGLRRLQPQ